MTTTPLTVSVSYTATPDTVNLHRVATHSDTVRHGQVKIIISSRDGHPVPPVSRAERLAEKARAAGWVARLTYALAEVPDRFFDNGNLAKAAHQRATVAVRCSRPAARAWAVWESIDAGSWKFVYAFLGLERLTLTSIMERISQ